MLLFSLYCVCVYVCVCVRVCVFAHMCAAIFVSVCICGGLSSVPGIFLCYSATSLFETRSLLDTKLFISSNPASQWAYGIACLSYTRLAMGLQVDATTASSYVGACGC